MDVIYILVKLYEKMERREKGKKVTYRGAYAFKHHPTLLIGAVIKIKGIKIDFFRLIVLCSFVNFYFMITLCFEKQWTDDGEARRVCVIICWMNKICFFNCQANQYVRLLKFR